MITIGNRTWFIFLTATSLTTFLVVLIVVPNKFDSYHDLNQVQNSEIHEENTSYQSEKEWRQISDEKYKSMSVLGRILYLGEDYPKPHEKKGKYKILVWKYGKIIEKRHLKQFGSKFIDPFDGCSVNNCDITYNDSDQNSADLILFHLHETKASDKLPEYREENQIWAFSADESPYHTFLSKTPISTYNNMFNWSMTYRMDSDIPVPYGRTIPKSRSKTSPSSSKPQEEPEIVKRRDVLVAILGSNCKPKNDRWGYVKELQKHIKVDVYGLCGTLETCPGHIQANCHDIDSYLFYLAFENSNCDEYVTEKLWWNAYGKNSIPVVMGASKNGYAKMLPPDSFLHVNDYASPKDLAEHLKHLNETGSYVKYYEWKRDYEIVNEHGYFGSKSWHYCRACEALNYNDKSPKVYTDLDSFWSKSRDCYPSWHQWVPTQGKESSQENATTKRGPLKR